jgi:outer membrane receptor protein involved in Fe transport
MQHKSLKPALMAGAVLFATAGAASAFAQTAVAADDDGGTEIVVTALHRESRLQDTPLSIVALTGDALQQKGATALQDYFRAVPNLNLTQGQFGTSRISIRGINAAGDATTGLYYDEVPVTGPSGTTQDAGNNAADLNLFDVSRVEVLRGPQGTLYGSSSMAGTLRVIFNKPDVSRVAAAGEAQISSVKSGSTGWFAKAMVNLPIVDDLLAVRVAGYNEQRPGFVDSLTFDDKNINDSMARGLRAMVALTPSPDTTVTGTYIYQKTTAADQQGWYPALGEYKTDATARLPFNSELNLYNIVINQKLGGVALTASADYYRYDILRTLDFTQTVNALSQVPAYCQAFYAQASACSTTQLASYRAYGLSRMPAIGYQPAWLKAHNYEVRLASDNDSIFQWTVGGYYELRNDRIDSNTTSVNPATGEVYSPLQNLSYRYVETRTRQTAGFGEVSLEPVKGLTLTGGLRYYDYSKRVQGEAFLGSVLTGSAVTPFASTTTKSNGWLEKFNISYAIRPGMLVYATASRGFRPGGVNNIPALPGPLVSYAPDSLWNYEAGFKTGWLNDRLTLNGALFHIDWSNMQVSTRYLSVYGILTNAGKARVRGAELELTARPFRSLDLSAAAGYVDAKLTQDQVNSYVAATGLAGDAIPNTPRWTASASAAYRWSLTGALTGMLRADFAYTGKMASDFRPDYVYYLTYGDYATLDLRASVEAENWTISAFMQNAGDVKGITGATSGLGYNRLSYSIAPRTVGLNVSVRY